jgi:hypothetical protein
MKFDVILQQALESINNNEKIPAFDGEREVYFIDVDEGLSVQPLQRMFDLTTWDASSQYTVVGGYERALYEVTRWYSGQTWASFNATPDTDSLEYQEWQDRVQLVSNQIANQLQPLKNIPGKWQVMDRYGNELTNRSTVCYVAMEIDLAHARSQQIQQNAQNLGYNADELL